MQQIPLQTTPQQNFTITLNDTDFEISLRMADDIMLISISAGGVEYIKNAKCFPDQPILQFPYLQKNGDFWFKTVKGAYPNWQDFENTCFLFYLSPEDLAAGKA